ncbi:MAG: sigma factor [Armatimonadota bacterium]
MAAEDLAQEAFVHIYVQRRRFDPSRGFSPWFCRILTNLCLDHLRRERHRGGHLSLLSEDEGRNHRTIRGRRCVTDWKDSSSSNRRVCAGHTYALMKRGERMNCRAFRQLVSAHPRRRALAVARHGRSRTHRSMR